MTLDVARPKDVVATQGLGGQGLPLAPLMPMQMMPGPVQRAQKIFVRRRWSELGSWAYGGVRGQIPSRRSEE